VFLFPLALVSKSGWSPSAPSPWPSSSGAAPWSGVARRSDVRWAPHSFVTSSDPTTKAIDGERRGMSKDNVEIITRFEHAFRAGDETTTA
jgi:hypothetical protein